MSELRHCELTSACSPDVEDVSRSLESVAAGPWTLIYEGDNLVFRSGDILAKVARHPDGRERLENGIRMASLLSGHGIPTSEPASALVDTDAGPAVLWRYIPHRPVDPARMTYDDGFAFASALAALSRLGLQVQRAKEPLERVPYRLSSSRAPQEVTVKVQHAYETVSGSIHLDWSDLRLAHGDASSSNALFTSEGVLLVDLDAAGLYPIGWDLSCLRLHLLRRHRNDRAWAGASEAWPAALCEDDLQRMEIVKAMLSTSFMLTLEPTSTRLSSIVDSCLILERWVSSGVRPLDRLPSVL